MRDICDYISWRNENNENNIVADRDPWVILVPQNCLLILHSFHMMGNHMREYVTHDQLVPWEKEYIKSVAGNCEHEPIEIINDFFNGLDAFYEDYPLTYP